MLVSRWMLVYFSWSSEKNINWSPGFALPGKTKPIMLQHRWRCTAIREQDGACRNQRRAAVTVELWAGCCLPPIRADWLFWLFSPVAAPHRCLPTPTRGSFFSQSRGTLPESITETGQERSEHHSVHMFLSYLDPDAECPPAASQTELQHPDVSHPPATERTCFTYQSNWSAAFSLNHSLYIKDEHTISVWGVNQRNADMRQRRFHFYFKARNENMESSRWAGGVLKVLGLLGVWV